MMQSFDMENILAYLPTKILKIQGSSFLFNRIVHEKFFSLEDTVWPLSHGIMFGCEYQHHILDILLQIQLD